MVSYLVPVWAALLAIAFLGRDDQLTRDGRQRGGPRRRYPAVAIVSSSERQRDYRVQERS